MGLRPPHKCTCFGWRSLLEHADNRTFVEAGCGNKHCVIGQFEAGEAERSTGRPCRFQGEPGASLELADGLVSAPVERGNIACHILNNDDSRSKSCHGGAQPRAVLLRQRQAAQQLGLRKTRAMSATHE